MWTNCYERERGKGRGVGRRSLSVGVIFRTKYARVREAKNAGRIMHDTMCSDLYDGTGCKFIDEEAYPNTKLLLLSYAKSRGEHKKKDEIKRCTSRTAGNEAADNCCAAGCIVILGSR